MYPHYENPKFKYSIEKGRLRVQSDQIDFKLNTGDILAILKEIKKNQSWLAMVNVFLIKDSDTATGKLACPFPISCNEWDHCINTYCNADVCSNGYTYRML